MVPLHFTGADFRHWLKVGMLIGITLSLGIIIGGIVWIWFAITVLHQ